MIPTLEYAPPGKSRFDWGKIGYSAIPLFWLGVIFGPWWLVLIPLALIATVILFVTRRC